MSRLIIAGSRHITSEQDYLLLKSAVLSGPKPAEIVSGGAKGPDQMGERIANEFGIPVKRFIPDWDGKGKGAGFLRNGDMAVYASNEPGGRLIALWDGESRGTAQMIDVARNYGLDVQVLSPTPGLIPMKDITPTPFIFKQSHSSLNVFETCPRQYQAKYLTKEVKFVQGTAAKWGDDVHLALEQYLLTKGAARLPSNMAQYEPYGAFVLERAARRGGTVLAERKSAVSKGTYQSTTGNDRNALLGGKIDVTILYPAERKAEVFDWKTGKVKNDVTQLKLYNGFTLADYPDIDEVRGGYVWLEHNQVTPPLVTSRPEVDQVWAIFQHKYNQLKDAYVRGAWPPKPNGLCKQYCDVVKCEYHGKGRY